MMKFNAKVHCGVKVMIEIAIQSSGALLKDIAEKHLLSIRFLDLIFANLKAAGLIRKLAGRKGYVLIDNPYDISVYKVYRAFEPELELFHCVSCESVCIQSGSCATSNFFKQLNQKTQQEMDSVTIGNLMEQQLSLGQK